MSMPSNSQPQYSLNINSNIEIHEIMLEFINVPLVTEIEADIEEDIQGDIEGELFFATSTAKKKREKKLCSIPAYAVVGLLLVLLPPMLLGLLVQPLPMLLGFLLVRPLPMYLGLLLEGRSSGVSEEPMAAMQG
ncbi:hypothetical protein GUJ93_ZPchr0002g24899 [Zizania palustris]|uniref:Uncharacterized protein n=1 Tax=Zizania palustris TaxID=103762 RepID=A0A8J5VGP5_ZIZPA|nr:hypothetical protein GUJ93_ZPchr0002g24899 [Zizania palustris]